MGVWDDAVIENIPGGIMMFYNSVQAHDLADMQKHLHIYLCVFDPRAKSKAEPKNGRYIESTSWAGREWVESN